MSNICRIAINGVIVFAALVLLLPEEAYAQPGKRICGRWAQTPGGYVGLLVEVENSSQFANVVCDKVRSFDPGVYMLRLQGTDSTMKAINAYLYNLNWQHQSSTACENVGKMFRDSKHNSDDMCDFMDGYSVYAVVTNNGVTTYFKRESISSVDVLTSLASSVGKFVSTEASVLAAYAKSTYASVANDVVSGYNASVNAFKAAYTAAIEALFRTAGNAFLSDAKTTLNSLQSALTNLDSTGKDAITRIRRAIPSGQLSAQSATDLKTVATKLGMAAGKNIPKNVVNSSWGVPLGGGAGKLIFGVEGDVAFVMNVQPNSDGKYACGIAVTAGGSLGLSVQQEANAEAGAGIIWQPGTITDNQGWSVGFGVSGGVAQGFGAGLSWGVSKGMSGAENAIPGIEINATTNTGVDASFKAGYTKLIWQGSC